MHALSTALLSSSGLWGSETRGSAGEAPSRDRREAPGGLGLVWFGLGGTRRAWFGLVWGLVWFGLGKHPEGGGGVAAARVVSPQQRVPEPSVVQPEGRVEGAVHAVVEEDEL